MEEAICAENNVNPFSFYVVPIPQAAKPDFAMSLNAAFGGANTALVIGLP